MIDYLGFAYAAVVAVGGVMGYIKAGSVMSLGAGNQNMSRNKRINAFHTICFNTNACKVLFIVILECRQLAKKFDDGKIYQLLLMMNAYIISKEI